MAQPLPSAASAIVDLRKMSDYLLSETHPRGRHKARVFRAALGLGPRDAEWLRDAILAAVPSLDAVLTDVSVWGQQWRVDIPLTRQRRFAVVRSVWLVPSDSTAPRLMTAWVL